MRLNLYNDYENLLFFRDDGTCKHCTALLFALTDFCGRHMDRNTQAVTDRPCIWDVPRKISVPKKIDDLDIRYNTKTACIEPTPATFNS